VTKKGKTGAEEIQQMMVDFRKNPPTSLGGSPVIRIDDYKELTRTDKDGNKTVIESGKLGIESSNVIQFFTVDGTKFTCRPSGTEPKIKFYVGVKGELQDKANYSKVMDELKAKVETIVDELGVK
ncbi:MAG: phospho-sugar mutase, partial [Spirosomaceae bacterium]|nr:phospho-sugar mutase [Spirosomataceae bacterium]